MDYLFIATHLGAGGNLLLNSMSSTDEIRSCDYTGFVYHSPPDLITLRGNINKDKSRPKPGTIYADILVYNSQIASKHFYNNCKWIYLIREPEGTLKELIGSYNYIQENAEKYYSFRLRRLCEMARNTPKALVLHFNDLHNINYIKNFINIREKLDIPIIKHSSQECVHLSSTVLQRANLSWRRYTKFLRKLPLEYPAVLC